MFGPGSPIDMTMERQLPQFAVSRMRARSGSFRSIASRLVAALVGAVIAVAITSALRVDVAGARVPVDPLLREGVALSGEGEEGAGQLGLSVAVSADGTTALVGGPHDNESAGAAWVFVRSGSTWRQQGPKLLPSGPAERSSCEEPILSGIEESENECGFGASVALSGDGNTALVGSPRDLGHKGRVWVFTRTGSTWSAPEQLTGAGEVGEGHFGRAVVVSEDGSVALVSAPSDNNGRGAVWSFTRTGSGWSTMGEAKITASGEAGQGYFGRGLAISPDGATALIGAPGDSKYAGAAWMFSRAGSTWTQQNRVVGSEEQGDGRFGFSVAVSNGATAALVGAPRNATNTGAVWPFERSGSALAAAGPALTGEGEIGEGLFARTLAISADGTGALVGAPHDNAGFGAAWVLARSPVGWTEERVSPGTRGLFGASVAISADGTTPLFGAPVAEHKVGVVWAGVPTPVASGEPPLGGSPPGGLPWQSGEATGTLGSTGTLAFSASGVRCRLALVSRNVAVLSHGRRAALRVRRVGSGRCSAKLTLTVRARGNHGHIAARSLGSARAVVSMYRPVTVRVALNAFGRSLLRAGHGQVRARLLVAPLAPPHARAQAAAVRLRVHR
jgi:hypothetical protein